MCGRFTLRTSGRVLAELFQLPQVPELPLRYNIAPTQPVAAVRSVAGQGQRELVQLRWGLIPSWAEDKKIGARLINARAETAAAKPSFRSAFRHRRCLLPADGFYEWQRRDGKKQPFYLRLRDDRPFAFAGLWETWTSPDSEVIESAALLTTEANATVRPVHDRMPVILAAADYARWLDPAVQKAEVLQPLLRPYPAEEMTAHRVSLRVNAPRNDDPKCIEAMA
jgi:putative SOS response-associated peptidase YedK